jgi:hypothetical protein
MNELNMLKDLGAAIDPVTDGPSPRQRHRVLNTFEGRPPGRRRRLRVSLGWSLATSGGLAAVLAVALIAGSTGGSGPSGNRPDRALVASDILLRAAANLRADKTPPPRPDQFVYVQSISAYMPSGTPAEYRPKLRQVWTSVDGTHDGLLRESAMPGKPRADDIIPEVLQPGCVNRKAVVVDQHRVVHRDQFAECDVYPSYQAELPTDAEGMLRHLRSVASQPNDEYVFYAVKDEIGEHYLTPAQLAALFEAAARLPSVVVVPDVVDIAGRHGVAVALQLPAFDPTGASPSVHLSKPAVYQQQLIFDPSTHAYLGQQAVAVAEADGHKRGDFLGGSAILKNAIVDRVGQVG